MTFQILKSRYENQKTLQFRQLNVCWTLRRNSNMELILTLLLQSIWSTTKKCVQKQVSN